MRKFLWHHAKTCPYADREDTSKRRTVRAESSALLHAYQFKSGSERFRKDILNNLIHDKISEVLKADPIILQFGMLKYEKLGKQQDEYIRQSMRVLARVLIQLREEGNPSGTLEDFLTPSCFDIVVESVRKLSHWDMDSRKRDCKTPSLALKLGIYLKKCSSIIRAKALRNMDSSAQQSAEAYLHLHDLEWTARVSAQALSVTRGYSRTDCPLQQEAKWGSFSNACGTIQCCP